MRAWWIALTAAAVLVAAGSAQAQRRPGDGGGMGPGRGLLLMNPSVQTELKLTDDQKAELKKVGESDDAKAVREAMRGLRGLSEDERAAKMKELAPKLEAQQKATLAVLKDDQAKRLKQIELQQGGLASFADETVQKELKLSDEQKDKLKKIEADAREEMAEIRKDMQGGNFREGMEKMTKARKDNFAKATGLLSEDQKKAWQGLTGAPFEVKFEFPGRPGGPGTPGGTPGERPRRPGTEPKPGEKKDA